MTDVIPVEVDQVRRGQFGILWGVLKPHPRRKGFWLCASNEFPYDIIDAGRRALEEMPVVEPGYFKDGHPGISYWRSFQTMTGLRND